MCGNKNSQKSNNVGLAIISAVTLIEIILLMLMIVFIPSSYNNELGSLLGGIIGGVLGGGATIFAFIKTNEQNIQHFKETNEENLKQFKSVQKRNEEIDKRQKHLDELQREKERYDRLPWLKLRISDESESKYIETFKERFVAFNNNENIEVFSNISKILHSNCDMNLYKIIKYDIINVSRNSALDIECSIQEKEVAKFDLYNEESFIIYVIIKKSKITQTTSLKLKLEYFDISTMYKYNQESSLDLEPIKSDLGIFYNPQKSISSPTLIKSIFSNEE